MPLLFTFSLSQQQTFELRCNQGSRRLDQTELSQLINLCESNYYSERIYDRPDELKTLGRKLYQWLDGKEGWLRSALDEADEQTIYLDLSQTSDAQSLNPETNRVGLALAHLPWELLHDGKKFLLATSVLPVRKVQQRKGESVGALNRPLRLLFMATSPDDITPILSYEQEETNILQATKEQPLALIVEESGSVSELGELVKAYEADYFDIFHLTGHGLIYEKEKYGYLSSRQIEENTPCFITEDDVGKAQLTTVSDLAKAFRNRFPRVIFLSGCHTGQVPRQGTVPSMAQALVKAGAGVVLGWARPVFDSTGIIAAQALYKALATGASIEDAVKAAQLEMIEQNCRDWHLLRIYRDSRPISELVTPLRAKGREKLKPLQTEADFLDAERRVKVASRLEFFGRRRSLQRCLKALKETSEQSGVFIHGMGGLGKSTLTARLCTRVRAQRDNYQQVVLIGPLDEAGLLGKLANKYEQVSGITAILNQLEMSLKGRLQNFFEAIQSTEIDRPLLLILDDFEQNIPPENVEDGSLRMSAEAFRVLDAICAALAETQAVSRLIVTCRYLCPLPENSLHLEALASMSASDIDKKGRLLPQEVRDNRHYRRIVRIADGNPRLLEWLAVVLQQTNLDTEELLTRLEQTQEEFREDIVATTLLKSLTEEEQKFLARLSTFRLSVPLEILSAVTPDVSFLSKAVSLSLVEEVIAAGTQKLEYRVTTILEPLLKDVLSQAEWQTSQQQAVQKVYQVWWEEVETSTDERGLEIVRLGLLAGEQEITASVGKRVASHWYDKSRFLEAGELSKEILAVFTDYRILRSIADAEEVLGNIQEALAHYEEALTLCPNDDIKEKAATLSNMAGVITQQGDIPRALELWQQSLQLKRGIGDVQGEAATLSNMAGVIAQQGDIPRALNLWQQSLQLERGIGDVQGEAATLASMAYYAGETGEKARQLQLNLQAAQGFGQVQAYIDLAIVLSNLGVSAESNNIVYLAQTVWLSLKIHTPLEDTIQRMVYLYQQVSQGDELQALLATTAQFFCQIHGEGHPQLEELQQLSSKMLIAAAGAQGIETQEAFDAWIIQQQLNNPEFFLPRLSQCLEVIVGDGWLFEREGLG
jgi:tetratricopeptide (TPR) repeat protein